MKSIRLSLASGVLTVFCSAAVAADPPATAPATAPAAAPAAPALKDSREKASYALGVGIARNMKQNKLESVDPELLARGIRDVFSGGKLALGDEELNTAVVAYFRELNDKAGAESRKQGEEFLAANKAKPGVQTTKSGLQYKVLTEGKGATPKATDMVKTHYKGTFIDGKEFDSSIARGEPAVFPVRGVIPGWVEALQLMKVGDKWQLFVPSDLAYGADGNRSIPPHSTLLFEIELLGIEKAPAGEPPQ